MAASAAFTAQSLRGDDAAVPEANFTASRYEVLWTKSPFAVATSEASMDSSPDYFLVGIANVEGISYASVVERQSQEHFVISTDKATRGLLLTSITRGHDGSETYATVQKNGQSITLKLEQQPVAATIPGAQPTPAMPGVMTPQIPMPGAGSSAPGSTRPPITRFRRPPINLPPRPEGQQAQPAPTTPTQPASTPPK
jgi:hypothetical protein